MTSAGRLRFDHVAFDLDGTLVDSRADLAAATNYVLRSFSLPEIAPCAVYALVGEGARRLVERALGASQTAAIDEGVKRFLAYYADHLLDATMLYPAVRETLDTLLEAGVGLSILSNKPEGLARVILAGLGVGQYFQMIIGGDTLPTRKPDPAGLERLCRTTGTAPTRMLLVGDSPVDVATAVNAGTAFCGVAWGIDPDRLLAARPLRLIASPGELIDLVFAPQATCGGRAHTAS